MTLTKTFFLQEFEKARGYKMEREYLLEALGVKPAAKSPPRSSPVISDSRQSRLRSNWRDPQHYYPSSSSSRSRSSRWSPPKENMWENY